MSGTCGARHGGKADDGHEEPDAQGDHRARGLRPLAHVRVSSFLGVSAERCWSGAVGTNLGEGRELSRGNLRQHRAPHRPGTSAPPQPQQEQHRSGKRGAAGTERTAAGTTGTGSALTAAGRSGDARRGASGGTGYDRGGRGNPGARLLPTRRLRRP